MSNGEKRTPLSAYVLLSGGPLTIIIWVGGMVLLSTPHWIEAHPVIGNIMVAFWMIPFLGVAILITPAVILIALLVSFLGGEL